MQQKQATTTHSNTTQHNTTCEGTRHATPHDTHIGGCDALVSCCVACHPCDVVLLSDCDDALTCSCFVAIVHASCLVLCVCCLCVLCCCVVSLCVCVCVCVCVSVLCFALLCVFVLFLCYMCFCDASVCVLDVVDVLCQ